MFLGHGQDDQVEASVLIDNSHDLRGQVGQLQASVHMAESGAAAQVVAGIGRDAHDEGLLALRVLRLKARQRLPGL